MWFHPVIRRIPTWNSLQHIPNINYNPPFFDRHATRNPEGKNWPHSRRILLSERSSRRKATQQKKTRHRGPVQNRFVKRRKKFSSDNEFLNSFFKQTNADAGPVHWNCGPTPAGPAAVHAAPQPHPTPRSPSAFSANPPSFPPVYSKMAPDGSATA